MSCTLLLISLHSVPLLASVGCTPISQLGIKRYEDERARDIKGNFNLMAFSLNRQKRHRNVCATTIHEEIESQS